MEPTPTPVQPIIASPVAEAVPGLAQSAEEKLLAFADTETNGMLSPKYDLHDRKQGWIVQVAVILTKLDGTIVDQYTDIITPDHYDMPDFIAAIHGITVDRAAREGKPRLDVMRRTQAILERAHTIICHNYDFDSKMFIAEEQRDYGFVWPSRRCCCTMKELTAVVGAKKSNGAPKWPKLMEAYQFAFGKPFEGAHDALVDVLATRDVYLWAVQKGHIKL